MWTEMRRVVLAAMLFVSSIKGGITDWGTCLQKPQVNSGWIAISPQNPQPESEHGIGSFPIKVDVQIRPENSRPENDYYFPGIGSSQRNNGVNSPYGGIVYYYNEESVTLFFPTNQNGYDIGRAIYTGADVWKGPVQQSEIASMYRVRVWGKEDFPRPDFESMLIPTDTNTKTYHEISHGLGMEPDYTLVQVKLPTGFITEAVGCSMELQVSSADWGGVIYSYNDKLFKLWSPNNGHAGIFSAAGWGKDGTLVKTGEVKIYAWKNFFADNKFQQTLSLPSISTTTADLEHRLDRDFDLMDIKVKALDGKSVNFIFHASGAVQNIREGDSIGGVVYSYSDTKVRFWYPRNGSMLLIDQLWGKPNTQHSSQNVNATIAMWKAFDSCPPVTTFNTKLTPPPTTTLLITDTTVASSKELTTTQSQIGPAVTNLNTTLKSSTQLKTDAALQSLQPDKKGFSFSNADVPTILVGAGFGVGGTIVLFIVSFIVKMTVNKLNKNEVKPV